jgi:8-oxo-dGTP diphosphatase
VSTRPPSPGLTVDIIVERALDDGRRAVLLVERRFPPHGWALPGGFVDPGEPVEAAALRELREETGLDGTLDALLGVYSDPQRDRRGHTVSVVFAARAAGPVVAADDAAAARFWPLHALPELAFDHGRILADYVCPPRGIDAVRPGASVRARR